MGIYSLASRCFISFSLLPRRVLIYLLFVEFLSCSTYSLLN
jgi:hypothetical protein